MEDSQGYPRPETVTVNQSFGTDLNRLMKALRIPEDQQHDPGTRDGTDTLQSYRLPPSIGEQVNVTEAEAEALESLWDRWVCLNIAEAMEEPTDTKSITDTAMVAVTWAKAIRETLVALDIPHTIEPDDAIPRPLPGGPELGHLRILDLAGE